MAIQVNGTEVISNSRALNNIASVDATTANSITAAGVGGGAGSLDAWVNFNGTGSVSIRADGNVSSITDNGVGQYTVNFSTSFTDANYATSVTSDINNGSYWSMGGNVRGTNNYSSSSVQVRSLAKQNGSSLDAAIMGVNMVR